MLFVWGKGTKGLLIVLVISLAGFRVNTLRQTGGHRGLAGGTYHDVEVGTEGNNSTVTSQHG